MGESILHYKTQWGLNNHILILIGELLATTTDPAIHTILQSIDHSGTADIKWDSKILKQADASFGRAGTLPSLVCEVS
jgi:ABC-type transporter Mla MlaB component